MGSCDPLFRFKYLTFSFLSQETIEDIDKNGDGFIDLKEYIGEVLSIRWSIRGNRKQLI